MQASLSPRCSETPRHFAPDRGLATGSRSHELLNIRFNNEECPQRPSAAQAVVGADHAFWTAFEINSTVPMKGVTDPYPLSRQTMNRAADKTAAPATVKVRSPLPALLEGLSLCMTVTPCTRKQQRDDDQLLALQAAEKTSGPSRQRVEVRAKVRAQTVGDASFPTASRTLLDRSFQGKLRPLPACRRA